MSAPAPQFPAPAVPESTPAPVPDLPGPAPRNGWSWPVLLLPVVALLPAVIAVLQLGRIHPDEVYQALEPAWWRVHGYGVLAWEWKDGIRNWAVPGVLAGFLKLADLLGITRPQGYRAVVALPQAALHVWSLWAAYRFAARRAGPVGGWLAVLLVGLYGPVLVFAGRTLGESFSASFLVVAMEALDRRERPVRAGLVGGAALGLAVVTRYPSAIFVLASLVWLVAARRWRLLAFTCAGGLAVAAGLGALDWATWGSPFHSFIAYARFNVFSGDAAARFGSDPPSYYARPLLTAVPLWAWGAALLGVAALRQRRSLSLPLWCAAVYTGVLLATAHKEERFLYPGLVLAVLAAAAPVAAFITARARPAARWSLVALALATGLGTAAFFPSGDLRADQFRAIVAATEGGGARGLLIVNEGLWGAGGFFYLGQQIPWLTCDWPRDGAFQHAMRDRNFNRAVTFEDRALAELQAAGFRVARRIGRETLLVRE
ncbi:glycosyltransferase family 39 protein [Pyxidicoccus sp. MSG2]|uniref:glycosyltransferase family 39 protein n=1 Tax=Pyxidicoccus sp. MSG2 TaxID=2996790 RepID=UPI00226F89D8|nr:glycosyltransferase family 39 protein [Pyxidicoccus sp. MSG2]MCY1016047.1 glycosyltransferase family 39 protein [Pyxidicoccus sp. MSG2]